MKFLIVLNDAPYGTERSYNGLRLVLALAKHEENEIKVFLMADAVAGRAGRLVGVGRQGPRFLNRRCRAAS